MKLFDKTLTTLERALDVRLARQNVLSGNLANANTPGYKPVDLDFGRAMAHLESAGEGASAASSVAALTTAAAASEGLDGNAVDLDRTMVDLAQNSLQYGASAKAAQKKLAILRYVASDGNA